MTKIYLSLALVFISASAVGIFYLYQPNRFRPVATSYDTIPPTLAPVLSEPTTVSDSPSPVIAPAYIPYSAENFAVKYRPYRTLSIESESSGQRYVFYAPQGNITFHVGHTWSWTHPGRQLTSDFAIDNLPTFRYDTDSQTIIDLRRGDRYFTIQCVHGSSEELMAECQQFVTDLSFTD